jgi:hypothetical protein
MDDWFPVSIASTQHCREREVNMGTIDVINSKAVDRTETQTAGKLLHLESTPPTSPDIENIKQSKQERPTKKLVGRNGKHPLL